MEENLMEKPIEINFKKLKLKKFFKKNRLPVIFGLLSFILIASGIISLFYFSKEENKIEIIPADKVSIEKKKIIIDVAGAVFKPGVYRLNEGDRLQDALVSAGGLSGEADREWVEKNLNLAVKLVDGNKVYIPKINESSIMNQESRNKESVTNAEGQAAGQVAGVVVEKININTASMADLDTLYGVGEKTAQKIIAGRPYSKIEELVEKKVIYQSAFEKIKEKISTY